MFIIVIDFGDDALVLPITGVKQAERAYSIASLIFPSAKVSVYQLVKLF
jgi:hypothetical protein